MSYNNTIYYFDHNKMGGSQSKTSQLCAAKAEIEVLKTQLVEAQRMCRETTEASLQVDKINGLLVEQNKELVELCKTNNKFFDEKMLQHLILLEFAPAFVSDENKENFKKFVNFVKEKIKTEADLIVLLTSMTEFFKAKVAKEKEKKEHEKENV